MNAGGAQWSREELLNLFASYFPRGHESVREISAELSLTRRGRFMIPEKVLIILFASRAGSNFFGQLLSSTGWFNEIGESFAPHTLAKIQRKNGLRDTHDAVQWMIDNRGTPDAFGFKAGFYLLAAAAEVGFLSEVIDRAQFVLLRRRDRVAQAVSRVKGKLSGQMHSLQPSGRLLTDDDYDGEMIAAHFKRTVQADDDLAEMVTRLGKTAPLVYYEDICTRPQEHVAQICGLMGLPMPADYEPEAKVRLNILRDELSQRWVERFRANRARETGCRVRES